MGGHDYNPASWPGVIQAVHEFFPTDKLTIINGSWLTYL
jgi:hypothetical protein